MISAIIPTLNAGKNIDNLLTSLENQSVPCEIIVIDSSSSDRTLEIAASHNVKTITIKSPCKGGYPCIFYTGCTSRK
jgi:rhamnosyltransferase